MTKATQNSSSNSKDGVYFASKTPRQLRKFEQSYSGTKNSSETSSYRLSTSYNKLQAAFFILEKADLGKQALVDFQRQLLAFKNMNNRNMLLNLSTNFQN